MSTDVWVTVVVCSHSKPQHQSGITEIDEISHWSKETRKGTKCPDGDERATYATGADFIGFVEAEPWKPDYASCRIAGSTINDPADVKIRLAKSGESDETTRPFSPQNTHASPEFRESGKELLINRTVCSKT